VLGENGRESCVWAGPRASERVELTGIAAGSTAAAEGSTVVTTIGREVVVYRIE
jgi:hypothetical protein